MAADGHSEDPRRVLPPPREGAEGLPTHRNERTTWSAADWHGAAGEAEAAEKGAREAARRQARPRSAPPPGPPATQTRSAVGPHARLPDAPRRRDGGRAPPAAPSCKGRAGGSPRVRPEEAFRTPPPASTAAAALPDRAEGRAAPREAEKAEREPLGGVNLPRGGRARPRSRAARNHALLEAGRPRRPPSKKPAHGDSASSTGSPASGSSLVRHASTQSYQALFTTSFGGGEGLAPAHRGGRPARRSASTFVASRRGRSRRSSRSFIRRRANPEATAPIFAVFLTNPGAICVLDEIDAPLDDAREALLRPSLDEMTRSTRDALPHHHHH